MRFATLSPGTLTGGRVALTASRIRMPDGGVPPVPKVVIKVGQPAKTAPALLDRPRVTGAPRITFGIDLARDGETLRMKTLGWPVLNPEVMPEWGGADAGHHDSKLLVGDLLVTANNGRAIRAATPAMPALTDGTLVFVDRGGDDHSIYTVMPADRRWLIDLPSMDLLTPAGNVIEPVFALYLPAGGSLTVLRSNANVQMRGAQRVLTAVAPPEPYLTVEMTADRPELRFTTRAEAMLAQPPAA